MSDNVDLMKRRLERERQARKAAEKLLDEKSRELFEKNQELAQVALFAELSPNPVLRFDASGMLLLANQAAKRSLGEDIEVGKSLVSILPQFLDMDLESIVQGDVCYRENVKVGEYYMQFVFHGVAEHKFVNVYVSDITQLEHAKRIVEKAHQETEQLLASISSILIGVDKTLRVTRWNDTAQQTFGFDGEQVTGQLLSDCGISWNIGSIPQLISNSAFDGYAVIPEVVYKNAEDRDGFLNVVVSEVDDEEGNLAGYLVLATDITERKVLESQLVQAQKLESLGQLAAGVAHEINTPIQFVGDNTRFLGVAFERLNTVIEKSNALLEVVKASGMFGPIVEDVEAAIQKAKLKYMRSEIPFAIEETLGGVDHVANIVKAMKSFSHPGSHEKTVANVNESINNTINVARNEWKYLADLETDLDDSLPDVLCFPGELNQVILNMIVNAAHAIEDKHGPQKGKGLIKIGTAAKDGFVEIHIEDNGAGIPDHVVKKIFDPFFTTKEVGKGSGQGLSIAYNVIYEKHGGSISVDSVPGEGTTFVIKLPLELAAASEE